MTKALVLAGDFQSESTDGVRAMAVVAGRPFLEWQLLFLRSQGFSDIILCLDRDSDEVRAHFGNGSKLGLGIDYCVGGPTAGTASAIAAAAERLNAAFLLLHANVFFDVDYRGLLDFHKGKEAMLSIALAMDTEDEGFGRVRLDIFHRVTELAAGPGSDEAFSYINSGIYAVEPAIFKQEPYNSGGTFEDTVSSLITDRAVFGYASDGYLIDITTANGLATAEKLFSPYA